ncbi:hypothetical protein V6N12_025592 [Hibiscus sabdariffa]|uniref:Multiple C2 domain-containing protein n=1 Tax=Hibiscus sabdariffa TaxID=183260 RepID=A0ABR2CKR8_9ROSI
MDPSLIVWCRAEPPLRSEVVEYMLECQFTLVFVMCVVYGASQHRKRPRHPPHMDTKLSLVESVQSDYLDNEYDTSPTSKEDKILKNSIPSRSSSLICTWIRFFRDGTSSISNYHSFIALKLVQRTREECFGYRNSKTNLLDVQRESFNFCCGICHTNVDEQLKLRSQEWI